MSSRPISEDDLHAYVDQALEPERQAEVAAYLEGHPDVAQRIASFSDQRGLLRAALAPIADEPLPPQLNLSRIIEGQRRRTSAPSFRWAIAAMLMLAIGGISGWAIRGASETPTGGLAALAQEATDSYKVYASDHTRPVELRDSTELAAWVSSRLRQPVKLPDLSKSGYRFMGGRVVPTAHGPAAMFMYDNDHGDRLVVLTRPMTSDQNAPMAPHTGGDVAGFSWADGGLGYSLVGPSAAEQLRPLANEVRKQAQTI